MNPEVILGVLMSILIGLSGWTLYTVHGLAVNDATRSADDHAQNEALDEHRERLTSLEQDVGALKTDVARLEERTG